MLPFVQHIYWVDALWSLFPTAVLTVLFFWLLRVVIHMDRSERKEYSKIEAEERAKRGLPPTPPARQH